MSRLGLTALIALASLASLTGAPGPKFTYYLTGNGPMCRRRPSSASA